MWEAIGEILTSPNATIVLCFLVLFVILFAFLGKSGLLSITTNKVQLGAANKEREIIRQQVEWIRLHCEAFESKMEKPDDYDEWRGKYIVECVCDEYVEWVTFNHISTSSSYVSIKQERIVALVASLTSNDMFHSSEFEQWLRDDVKECIGRLVQIRETYGK